MPLVNSVYNANKCFAFLGPEIWKLLLEEVKQKGSLDAFKNGIKKLSPTNCPCRSCKDFLHGVVLLQELT